MLIFIVKFIILRTQLKFKSQDLKQEENRLINRYYSSLESNWEMGFNVYKDSLELRNVFD